MSPARLRESSSSSSTTARLTIRPSSPADFLSRADAGHAGRVVAQFRPSSGHPDRLVVRPRRPRFLDRLRSRRAARTVRRDAIGPSSRVAPTAIPPMSSTPFPVGAKGACSSGSRASCFTSSSTSSRTFAVPNNWMIAGLMTARYVRALLTHHERETVLGGLFGITGFRQVAITAEKHAQRFDGVDSATKAESRPASHDRVQRSAPVAGRRRRHADLGHLGCRAIAYMIVRVTHLRAGLSGRLGIDVVTISLFRRA